MRARCCANSPCWTTCPARRGRFAATAGEDELHRLTDGWRLLLRCTSRGKMVAAKRAQAAYADAAGPAESGPWRTTSDRRTNAGQTPQHRKPTEQPNPATAKRPAGEPQGRQVDRQSPPTRHSQPTNRAPHRQANHRHGRRVDAPGGESSNHWPGESTVHADHSSLSADESAVRVRRVDIPAMDGLVISPYESTTCAGDSPSQAG